MANSIGSGKEYASDAGATVRVVSANGQVVNNPEVSAGIGSPVTTSGGV
jgi:hypothetical protein